MNKTFVGIGFGPIQSGLFLLEAARSGSFGRLVVAEVAPELVAAVRNAQGRITVNIAHLHGIETQTVDNVEIYNPREPADAEQLVNAIAAADELATALPSVDFFDRGSPSTAMLLAAGLSRKGVENRLPAAVVYAAENHNRAAELLQAAVAAKLAANDRPSVERRVQFVNTVIGKMSGIVVDPAQIASDRLRPLVEGGKLAVLVEAFNRILISQIRLPHFTRGITAFQEKADLLPFEEAKLYGHNAAHALLGYLAHRRHLTYMHDAQTTDLVPFVEQAFLGEAGQALCRKYTGLDPLFTPAGWREYVSDLMPRILNPYLHDRVERVIRDPRRKLGWDDRLIGTMRIALAEGIEPERFALGAAAALELLQTEQPTAVVEPLLADIWSASASAGEQQPIIARIQQARHRLADFDRASCDNSRHTSS